MLTPRQLDLLNQTFDCMLSINFNQSLKEEIQELKNFIIKKLTLENNEIDFASLGIKKILKVKPLGDSNDLTKSYFEESFELDNGEQITVYITYTNDDCYYSYKCPYIEKPNVN